MDRKINVFIGGSTEGLKYAVKIKSYLEESLKIECQIWNNNIFKYNDSFLTSLTKASLFFDFGVFIATADDEATIREEVKEIPRDNIIFEYGLFLGAMGNNRTILIQEETSKIPSDLGGYSTPRFKKNYKKKDWSNLTTEVANYVIDEFKKSGIQLLPSTSLAIGYFNSFISKISKQIFDEDGCSLNKKQSFHKNATIKIMIPNKLSDDINAMALMYYKKEKLESDELNAGKRPVPIRYFHREKDDEVLIVDMPLTLNALRPSINLLLPEKSLGYDSDKLKLERKELENFKKTLNFLVNQDDYSKEIVVIEWNNN